MAGKSIPQRETTSEPDEITTLTLSDAGLTGLYQRKWEDSKLPFAARDTLARLEAQTRAADSINTLLWRDRTHIEDSTDNTDYAYAPVPRDIVAGLEWALDLILQNMASDIEKLHSSVSAGAK